jgi:hypothetical protein
MNHSIIALLLSFFFIAIPFAQSNAKFHPFSPNPNPPCNLTSDIQQPPSDSADTQTMEKTKTPIKSDELDQPSPVPDEKREIHQEYLNDKYSKRYAGAPEPLHGSIFFEKSWHVSSFIYLVR